MVGLSADRFFFMEQHLTTASGVECYAKGEQIRIKRKFYFRTPDSSDSGLKTPDFGGTDYKLGSLAGNCECGPTKS